MIEKVERKNGDAVEVGLRAELAQSEARNAGALPTLRHLLAFEASHLFGDEVLARIRGMQRHIAQQLLVGFHEMDSDYPKTLNALLDESYLLSHLHALALEGHIAATLEQKFFIDPVVPPLLEGMVLRAQADVQDLARQLIASQARWCQSLQRMQIDLLELPVELFEKTLGVLRELGGREAQAAEFRLRARYDESISRLGLAARLVLQMEAEASEALDLRHGGVALFATALSLGSGQSREQAILAMQDPQTAKLALGLRAAGLDIAAIQAQLMFLHNEGDLPQGFEHISADRASIFFTSDLEKEQ